MSAELDQKLKHAAERASGSPVTFQGFVPIVETFRGQTIWEGIVSMYESPNGRVYAWAVESDQGPQYVTALHKPPVDSPLAAVRAWLVSEARK
jgi:hypothetical protein